VEKLKKEQRQREELRIKEREERMANDFEKMLDLEIKRKRKETYARRKKGIFMQMLHTHTNSMNIHKRRFI